MLVTDVLKYDILADQGIALDKWFVIKVNEQTMPQTQLTWSWIFFNTVKKALFHTPWQNLIENGKIREYLKFFRKSKTKDVEHEVTIWANCRTLNVETDGII